MPYAHSQLTALSHPLSWLSRSFTTVHGENDPALASTSYCLTDNGCGNPLAYTTSFIPLSMLGCNSFCCAYCQPPRPSLHRCLT